jgi:predicted amidophosphoribosyltransferase
VLGGRTLRRLVIAAAELVLGSECAGCGAAPGLLCDECRAGLRGPARLVAGTDGGLRVAAAASYGGAARGAVLAHKEKGRLGLAVPLGDALATAVVAVLEFPGGCPRCGEQPMALVPVPSTRPVVRRRGHDPLARTARRAATVLRRVGYDCTVVPALRHRRAVLDQAGLDAAARRVNLAAALGVAPAGRTLLATRCRVLVDDVVTTGATLAEAARALTAAGRPPCAAAVITATPAQQRISGVDATRGASSK